MIGNIEIQNWARSMRLGQRCEVGDLQLRASFRGSRKADKGKWSVLSCLTESSWEWPLFLMHLNSGNLFPFLHRIGNYLIYLFVNTLIFFIPPFQKVGSVKDESFSCSQLSPQCLDHYLVPCLLNKCGLNSRIDIISDFSDKSDSLYSMVLFIKCICEFPYTSWNRRQGGKYQNSVSKSSHILVSFYIEMCHAF